MVGGFQFPLLGIFPCIPQTPKHGPCTQATRAQEHLKHPTVRKHGEAFFGESSEEYTVKTASDVEEACKLLEVGFEYVTEFDGKNCLGSESKK